MSTQQIPERENELGRQPEPNSQDGKRSMAFLVSYASYFVIAIVVITIAVMMSR